jgi:hypothetical protein
MGSAWALRWMEATAVWGAVAGVRVVRGDHYLRALILHHRCMRGAMASGAVVGGMMMMVVMGMGHLLGGETSGGKRRK